MTRTRMMMMIGTVAASLALAACGPSAQQQCAGANDPVTCAAVARSGGDVSNYLVGGLAGAALASAMSRPHAQPTVIHHAPSYGYRYQPSSYRRDPFAARTKTVTTTTKRGLFGARTVTRTTTSFRPSYRSRR